MENSTKALLVLANGLVFEGKSFGEVLKEVKPSIPSTDRRALSVLIHPQKSKHASNSGVPRREARSATAAFSIFVGRLLNNE